MHKAGVIIVTYNATPWIGACLESLKKQSYLEYTVYVIDNNSNDGTREYILSNFPWITLLTNSQNLGFAAGNNCAMKYAFKEDCEYVVLLNQDTVVEQNFIEEGVRILTKKEVGFASPKLLYKSNKKIWWAGSKLFRGKELYLRPFFQIAQHISKKEEDVGQFAGVFETDYIPGTSLFTRADVVNKVGFLDEKFFMYSEDLDWSLRAKKAGYSLFYFDTTTVLHDTPFGKAAARPSLKRIFFKYSNYFNGVRLVVSKHFTLKEKIIWYVKLPVTLVLTFLYEVL